MKKAITIAGIAVVALMLVSYSGAFAADPSGWITHVKNWWLESCALTDPTITYPSANYAAVSTGGHTLKCLEMGLGYVSATAITVTGGATPLACTGLSGVADAGSTEGYVTMDSSAADVLLFAVTMPQTAVITGTASDLLFQFDIDESGTDTTMVWNVAIYDGDTTAAIVSDTISIDSGAARAWVGLQTYAGGLGTLSALTVNDRLYLRLSPVDATDSGTIYGVRMKYRAGWEVTE